MKIKIVDAICGEGKTTAAIGYINECDNETKFLYITPFLTEVQRIKRQCIGKDFQEPQIIGNKIEGIKKLLNDGCNIVSTHSLFSNFDEQAIELAYLNNYVLVMDEVADVVQPLNVSDYDLKTILTEYAVLKEDGSVEWTAKKYRGEFEKYKRLCEIGCLAIYGKKAFIWMFPISVFKAFKEIFILTYLFEAQMQCYYYQYYGVEFEKLYVKDFKFTHIPQNTNIEQYKALINLCDNEKLNRIGDFDYSLSSAWYNRNKDLSLEQLRTNCYNYFFNITKTPTNLNMWTCFKDYKQLIKGRGYSKGFVSLGTRATNNFIHKQSLAYLTNTFMNPIIKNFFLERGITVNEDEYALSELIQWVFRSQLRILKPINLYLPSERMRKLLKKW